MKNSAPSSPFEKLEKRESLFSKETKSKRENAKISRFPSVQMRLSDIKCKRRKYVMSSFEFQTRNYVTCFGHICNHPHGQEN